MANAIEVSDPLSNHEEQIERAAKAVGRGAVRRAVFDAIYHHKSKVKSVGEIAKKTGLTRMRVLQNGRHLARKGIVRQTKKDGDTAYEKIDVFHAHKREILDYGAHPKKLARLATKRRPAVTLPTAVTIPSAAARVSRLTIDSVQSFAKVRKVKADGYLPESLSEKQFKRGVQKIIGEPGDFKDWGGETSDLYTTRLKMKKGQRVAAAFAFKGPGLKSKLVVGNMGKNGDQLFRLFHEDADVFFIQHWREIDPALVKYARDIAVAKSATTGRPIAYGVIDGQDSHRLYRAYSKQFR